MHTFTFVPQKNISQLPTTPGVYAFLSKEKEFLYIGKAIKLNNRSKHHFHSPGFTESNWIDRVHTVGYIETGSEIAALLLEAQLIKDLKPLHNVVWRDDKKYSYIVITKEDLPRVYITHQPKGEPASRLVGPFVDSTSLKKSLRFLRKIFPYYTKKRHPKVPCSWCHLDQCPGPNPDAVQYRKTIRRLVAVLSGGQKKVLTELRRDMKKAAKEKDFETAAKVRDSIYRLEQTIENVHVLASPTVVRREQSYATTRKELAKLLSTRKKITRIEAYDISNIQGTMATGSMVVLTNGVPDRDQYRKFKINIDGKPNDVAMMKEMITRRLQHTEWPLPQLMLVDGGKTQLGAALKAADTTSQKKRAQFLVASLAKRREELFVPGKKESIREMPESVRYLLMHIRDEAHRFALKYHRGLLTRAVKNKGR